MNESREPSSQYWFLRPLTDRKYFIPLAVLLWLGELVLNYAIINGIPPYVRAIAYTEIDWIAYMQEVKGVIDGEYNYTNLRGDTGPLVYPAGFVYIYQLLYYATEQGTNILRAQHIFFGIYMIFIAVIFYIYYKSKAVPPYTLILICLSRRIHSIFVLRLFNDTIAMLFLYIAIAFFINKRWSVGCFIFSLAVSVKMNILLFAPALLLLMLKELGLWRTIPNLTICGFLQLVLGAPFLMRFPWSYIKGSFDLGRKFFFIWSVNWKFVPEEIFLSDAFALSLLMFHVFSLLAFARKWTKNDGGLMAAITRKRQLTSEHIVTLMFQANFIGIFFARSLHFQFYVWYYHTLPYLLWRTSLPHWSRFVLLLVIEVVWNVFPSNPYTSATLFVCHIIIFTSLFFSRLSPSEQQINQEQKKQK